MAFVGYNKDTKGAFGVYSTEEEARNSGGCRERDLLVVEYDWQETDYLPSMTVSDVVSCQIDFLVKQLLSKLL